MEAAVLCNYFNFLFWYFEPIPSYPFRCLSNFSYLFNLCTLVKARWLDRFCSSGQAGVLCLCTSFSPYVSLIGLVILVTVQDPTIAIFAIILSMSNFIFNWLIVTICSLQTFFQDSQTGYFVSFILISLTWW